MSDISPKKAFAYIRIKKRDYVFRVSGEAEARQIAEFLKKKHKALTYALRVSGLNLHSKFETTPHTSLSVVGEGSNAPQPNQAVPYAVLIAEDEADLRALVRQTFEEHGCKVYEAQNARSALTLLNSTHVDLILSDVRMQGGDGLELLERVWQKEDRPAFVFMTAFDDAATQKAAAEKGILIIHKPFDLSQLVEKTLELAHSDHRSTG